MDSFFLKFDLFSFILAIFIGMLIIYAKHQPHVVIKKKNLDCSSGRCPLEPESMEE